MTIQKGLNLITQENVQERGRKEVRERCDIRSMTRETVQLALKMEEGDLKQKNAGSLWKLAEVQESPLEPLEGMQPC